MKKGKECHSDTGTAYLPFPDFRADCIPIITERVQILNCPHQPFFFFFSPIDPWNSTEWGSFLKEFENSLSNEQFCQINETY